MNGDGNNLSLSFPDSVERSNVSLSNSAGVNVIAGDGGSIAVNARNLEMTGESFLFAGIDSGLGSSNSKAGNIEVNATGAINLDNGSLITSQVLPEANGQGGDVNISASTLQVEGGARIFSYTSGSGNAGVLLVSRYKSLLSVEALLAAKGRVGDRLIGIVINDIPVTQLEAVDTLLRPFLEQQGIPVLAMLPNSDLLRSVSVGELVKQLKADVLCRNDRMDLLVESLAIGAMNVNSAVKYFRKRRNMAVVTGGDRVEIQQAALETSTQCLILTGQLPPPPFILSRAEDLEIPILSVDLDTLTTVEIVDRTFGQVRVHEPIKVQYIRKLMSEHFDIDRLLSKLDLTPAAALS
ncbi:phosphotransacetylase family protein [Nostoc sp. CHAB 5715]|uniref:phosphotransacetylase family protein n=1 Tax=Nostoc sp. CHAB 5715 TaxID=2780400 RepID=UPI001E3A492A|nr:phosphotransacetylase family protein [Nostoc sp. CHAB 5715]MCC5626413.1 phosphotransacetylase family protein [Nostoc sp. CHAB 5715]